MAILIMTLIHLKKHVIMYNYEYFFGQLAYGPLQKPITVIMSLCDYVPTLQTHFIHKFLGKSIRRLFFLQNLPFCFNMLCFYWRRWYHTIRILFFFCFNENFLIFHFYLKQQIIILCLLTSYMNTVTIHLVVFAPYIAIYIVLKLTYHMIICFSNNKTQLLSTGNIN